MLSEKWKENKRKERKERKELKINAPPLKQRPRLPPSLDGVRFNYTPNTARFHWLCVESDMLAVLVGVGSFPYQVCGSPFEEVWKRGAEGGGGSSHRGTGVAMLASLCRILSISETESLCLCVDGG